MIVYASKDWQSELDKHRVLLVSTIKVHEHDAVLDLAQCSFPARRPEFRSPIAEEDYSIDDDMDEDAWLDSGGDT